MTLPRLDQLPRRWFCGCWSIADSIATTRSDNFVDRWNGCQSTADSLLSRYPDPSSELTWFVDGVQIDSAEAVSAVWWTPTIGVHKLEVVDYKGLRAVRSFEVRQALN